jgi:glycogen(starch) synthase
VIGGIEILATKLLPALQERGYEFIVVTCQSGPERVGKRKFRGIPVYHFPFWKSHNNVKELMAIRQQVAQLKRTFAPHLIHKNAIGVGDFFHLTTANAHPAPLLITLHNDLRFRSLDSETSVRRVLQTANWVNSVSNAALKQAQHLLPEISSRSSVIYNGLEVPPVTPTPLPTEAPRVLCLGRLHTQKGFDLALRAFTSVVDRFPHARLILAGDGPERPALEQLTAQLGLRNVVDFLGWVLPEQVPALINTATVVLMPSRWEGLPLVALQAAYMARPVVAARVGGLPEVVAHHRTGLVVESENRDAFAQAITVLLNDTTTATRMGQAARIRVQKTFSWEHCVDAYDTLYTELITNCHTYSAPAQRLRAKTLLEL